MSFGTALYTLLLKPLQLIFEVIYSIACENIKNPGLSIIALSLAINFLVLPLYRRADAMQEEERETEAKLQKWVSHIKKTFHGDERTMMLQTYYRQNNYSPAYVLRGAVSLFLEIPFFIAAYHFLSGLELLEGVPFGPIADLAQPDALLSLGGISINVLPILMTVINIISSAIFSKNYPAKTKIQLYAMALFFLVFLYTSPAGLVFYWTLNNLFSLIKTIFYKLKNPRFVLAVLSMLTGCAALVWAVPLFLSGFRRKSVFVVLMGLILFLPLLSIILKKHAKWNLEIPGREPNKIIFFLGGLFLSILTGILIPSAMIKASPQEFMDINYFVHPLWYLVNSFLLAAGLFVLWLGVFYWLASPKVKPIFEWIIWLFCGVAVLDYLCFGTNLGLISSDLIFERSFRHSIPQLLINILAILVLIACMTFIFAKWRKAVPQALSIAVTAFVCMSVINCADIRKSVACVDLDSLTSDTTPHITLSNTGQNVVVIMLDRAMGEFIPYSFNEKPELKEQFSGFTYYANVVSFGGHTNYGSPALFGGYEYTPIEINRRNTESLETKQNEALKVMPVLFHSNGYDVTVFDPTYAGYEWTPDLSIYDDYENINSYITMGYFSGIESKQSQITNRNRNFFCYALMKISPLFAQYTLYNGGQYNQCAAICYGQVITNPSVASGLSPSFMRSYNVLQNLSYMTNISEHETGSFLMMSNDTTHDVALLEEPGYTPAIRVDNTVFDLEHQDRFTVNGQTLRVETAVQYMHYQSNMAAMIQLGTWFEYLKEQGVYDNTRIILVSDHGYSTQQIDSFALEDRSREISTLEAFYPLLLVKDFNSTGFSTSEEFMTTADVPTLAASGVIENPINPMTGKAMNSDEKTAHDQYIIASSDWDTAINNGNTFLPARWYTVHDSIWNRDNWTLVAEDAVLPIDGGN